VNPALVGLAVVVVAAGVVAVSVRDARLAVIGFATAAVLAPLLADPLPALLPITGRVVAALLAAYLLWVTLPVDAATRGSAVGWPAEALVAAACAVAGVGVTSAATGDPALGGAPGTAGGLAGVLVAGPYEALTAGFALAALSVGPLLAGRDALRVGLGLLLAVHAAVLVRAGLAGALSPFEQLATAGLIVALAASVAALAAAAIRSTGGLSLLPDRSPAAHRVRSERIRPGFRLPQLQIGESPAPPSTSPTAPEPPAADAPLPAEPAVDAGPIAPRSSGTRRIPGR
jgi:hypothetical protein